jgi:hypothetical protein
MNGPTLVPCEHVVFTDFDDGEGILVDLNTKRYFRLNETAALIWRGLEQKKSQEEIAGAMEGAYEVTREHACLSIGKLLQRLEASRLVRTV